MAVRPRKNGHPRANHAASAAQLRAWPGEWLIIRTYDSRYVAESIGRLIATATGKAGAHYTPAGAFETRTLPEDDGGTYLCVRYRPQDGEKQAPRAQELSKINDRQHDRPGDVERG